MFYKTTVDKKAQISAALIFFIEFMSNSSSSRSGSSGRSVYNDNALFHNTRERERGDASYAPPHESLTHESL